MSVCLILLFVSGLATGQYTIRGEVLEGSTSEALLGANVLIRGTSTGTITDWDGSFTLKVDSLPVDLRISYTGFQPLEITVSDPDQQLAVTLVASAVVVDAVEVTASRVSDKRKTSPLTVESLDIIAIKETAANDFYEGLGALKGVDLTTASLGFTIINTRGFNSTSPVRSLQIIDGVDNQAPGLNFSLGNFLGAPELDVLKVDLIQGASSAFYGPNAFNGVIDIRTKDPFFHRGLSASVKYGERNLLQAMVRYAYAFNDKWALKINGSYMRADDWVADNFDASFQSDVDVSNPGGYDAVNIYGDENVGADRNATSLFDRVDFPGLEVFHRRGYKEEELVNYDTENYKGNAGLFYRFGDGYEANATFNFGSGTTVYQGENRFRLEGIFFYQAKMEVKKKDKFFLRAYTTSEDAGESYDAYTTALALQNAAKSDNRWTVDYKQYYQTFIVPKVRAFEGYPTGFPFDFEQQQLVLSQNQDSLTAWHQRTQDAANMSSPNVPNLPFLVPGTPEFEAAFDTITRNLANDPDNPGTRFYDKSKLYHVHGEYHFETDFADFVAGANFRQYVPNSNGTIFSDTAGVVIRNNEFGVYGGITKKLIPSKLSMNVSLRLDKNQNFDLVASPAASLVYTPNINNVFRVSFSSALRNPTLADQYLYLNAGRAQLVGNVSGYDSLVTTESFVDLLSTQNRDTLVYFDEDPIQPEQVRTIEFGYRGTLFEKLWIDAGYYFSWYDRFIGFKVGIDITQFDAQTGFPTFFDILRISTNAESTVTTQGFSLGANYFLGQYLTVNGNYSWNILNKKGADDPIIPAFNTPEHKFNVGLSGRGMPVPIFGKAKRGFGFNINYKWVEGFLFEGSPQYTGRIPTYDLLDAQINWYFQKINTTIKVGATNILNQKQFQTYGGPRIGRLAYISVLYEGKPRNN